MRYREPFTVFKRTMKSGKIIWYYQAYDEDGLRTTAHSTGQTCKSAARAYCFKLLKEEKLIPNTRGRLTFLEYSQNWWIWDKCEYVAYRKSRRNLSQSYVYSSRRFMENHLVPFFGKKKLKDIKPYDIESWLQSFAKKGLSNQSANVILTILRIMLSDAVRRGYISVDPSAKIVRLKNNAAQKGVLTPDMVKDLFDSKRIEEMWFTELNYTINLTAAFTGMRIGELQAIRSKNICDGHIVVENHFSRKFGLTDTKTHKSRTIPIPKTLENLLRKYITEDPESFVFSQPHDRYNPLSAQSIRGSLYRALGYLGMDREEVSKRNITFHSWRHYFNTLMLRNNVPEQKIRMMTGHSSAAMTEHYTHLDLTDLNEVKEIQNQIINFPQNVG